MLQHCHPDSPGRESFRAEGVDSRAPGMDECSPVVLPSLVVEGQSFQAMLGRRPGLGLGSACFSLEVRFTDHRLTNLECESCLAGSS